MKKTVLCLLLVMMLLAAMPLTAFAAKAGDQVTITFTADRSDITGYQVTVAYPAELELVNIVGNAGLVDVYGNNVACMNMSPLGTTSLFTATFNVRSDAKPGTYYVSATVNEAYDADIQPTSLSIYGGSVTVECNHVAGAAVIENEKAATCGADGGYDTVVYCTVCGGELSREHTVVPATGKHTASAAVKENVVAATCGKAGSYDEVVYCSVCGHEMSRTAKTEPATGKHTPGAAVKENEVAATCGKAGSHDDVVYCSVCKTELSRDKVTDPATGKHTPGAAVKENVVAATCGKAGSHDDVVYCSVCKTELSRDKVTDPATGKHTAGTPVKENEVKATCTTAGSYDEVVYCTVCKEEISRETKTVPAAHTPGEPVKENIKEGTCQSKGTWEEVVYCTVCKEEISRKTVEGGYGGHKYDHDGKCIYCGAIENPNLPNQPDTGDIFVEIAVYASLAALAVGAVVFAKRKVRG